MTKLTAAIVSLTAAACIAGPQKYLDIAVDWQQLQALPPLGVQQGADMELRVRPKVDGKWLTLTGYTATWAARETMTATNYYGASSAWTSNATHEISIPLDSDQTGDAVTNWVYVVSLIYGGNTYPLGTGSYSVAASTFTGAGTLLSDTNQWATRTYTDATYVPLTRTITVDGVIGTLSSNLTFDTLAGLGDITAVTAGAGLTGGGLSGAVTLAVSNAVIAGAANGATALQAVTTDATLTGDGTAGDPLSVVGTPAAITNTLQEVVNAGAGESVTNVPSLTMAAGAGIDGQRFGEDAGMGASGNYWSAYGNSAGINASGANWSAHGDSAGAYASGNSWSAHGNSAGADASGNSWSAHGYFAGAYASGDYWSAHGDSAGVFASGDYWSAHGHYAGAYASGDSWSAHGYYAGAYASGDRWSAYGNRAGYEASGTNSWYGGQYSGRNARGDNRGYWDVYGADPSYVGSAATNDTIFLDDDGILYLGGGPARAENPSAGVVLRGAVTIGGESRTNWSGGVSSVNGATGDVVLDAADVGAVATNDVTYTQTVALAASALQAEADPIWSAASNAWYALALPEYTQSVTNQATATNAVSVAWTNGLVQWVVISSTNTNSLVSITVSGWPTNRAANLELWLANTNLLDVSWAGEAHWRVSNTLTNSIYAPTLTGLDRIIYEHRRGVTIATHIAEGAADVW